jgi:rhodanese-related sulfurtransferase
MECTTGPVELGHMLDNTNENINIVDVRAAEDYAKSHIPSAVNLPKERWSSFAGLSRDKVNILCCYTQTCHLAANAAVEFAAHGYHVMAMEGGFEAWLHNELPVETGQHVLRAT